MLTAHDIDIPASLEARLRERAAFAQSPHRFHHDHLTGFHQPVAVAAALIGPILVAFVYLAADFFTMLEVAGAFSVTTVMFLGGAWFTNRDQIQDAYRERMAIRKRAKLDLKCGRGRRMILPLSAPPVFYEHDEGVIVLAPADAETTVYFDVPGDGSDPRWYLYLDGELSCARWEWLALGGSGEVAEFSAAGEPFPAQEQRPFVDAGDAWEAITLALGDPRDGDVIKMPFAEAVKTVDRLL